MSSPETTEDFVRSVLAILGQQADDDDVKRVAQKVSRALPKRRLFKVERARANGWSDWIHPLPGYLMKCCDCGLVHEMELRIDDAGRPNFRMRRTGA